MADENLALLGAERRRALLASLVLVSLLVSGIAVVTGGKPLEPVHTVLAAFGTLIAQLGTVFPIRRQIAAHRASRRLFAGYTAVMSGSLAFRLGAMLAGASTAEILRADSFLMATTLAMMALPVDPRLVVPPLALLAGALAMLIFPGQEHNIFPIAGVISVAIAAFVLSRITRDAERANV